MYGWTGKLLRVDLTNKIAKKEDDTDYTDRFIGGIGFGTRIFWEEVPPNVQAFDPENKLLFMVGPATGTVAPASGRVELMGVAPQSYPHERFSRSGMGGFWGDQLKFAGYDGLIIEGRADKPTYIWIYDDKVELKDASHLWGQGAFNTMQILRNELVKDISILAIGQAGENLVRLATIQGDASNAFGQGGFGAVMGSKNLKAIAVRGTGSVKLAKPDELLDLCKGVRDFTWLPGVYTGNTWTGNAEQITSANWKENYGVKPDNVAKYGEKLLSCGANCPCACQKAYTHVSSPHGGLLESSQFCATFSTAIPKTVGTMALLHNASNDWGINQWSLRVGFASWIQYCCNAGYLHDVGGVVPMMVPEDSSAHPSKNPVRGIVTEDSLESWFAILKTIAFREGDVGDKLAEGLGRACDLLGFGEEFREIMLVKDGCTDHCGSRYAHSHHFPFWLWAVLITAIDYRDPSSDCAHILTCHQESLSEEWGGGRGHLSTAQLNAVAQHVWDVPGIEPKLGYDYREQPAFWVQKDAKMKNSLILCDYIFPMLYGSDGLAVLETPKGHKYEGPEVPCIMYNYVTGKSIDMDEYLKIGERILNMERAIEVREGRVRKGGWYTNADESVIPYYEKWNDCWGENLDAGQFRTLLDRYYTLVGWDKTTGWPTRAKLEELDLKDVADELGSIGKLP